MNIKRNAFRIALAFTAVAAVLVPAASQAQVPGPHPAYLHALSDLRAARHYLHDGWAWGPVRHDDDVAIREIDAAINEIKVASIDDGKGDADPFPIDRGLSPHDRFRKANELLASAHHDLDHAHQVVDNAWRTAHWDR